MNNMIHLNDRLNHSPKKLMLKLSILILIVIFMLLALNLRSGFIGDINNLVNTRITTIEHPLFIEISRIISVIFDTYGVILISAAAFIYLFLKGKRKESLIFASMIVLSSLSVTLLKNIFLVARPINELMMETDFSFPSGHSSIAVVLFGFLAYFVIKQNKNNKNDKIIRFIILIISAIGILIVAFSRLYLNVHWISDVIGGLIIGTIWLLLAILLLKKESRYKQIRI